jgi:hypothetical protein
MNRDRFSGVFNASRWPVTLVGLGGIGSNLAVMLGKMGFNPLTVVDGDKVSEENIGTQLYEQDDVGGWKTAVTTGRLGRFSPDTQVYTLTAYVEGDTPWHELASPIVVSAVDSIAARQAIWAAIAGRDWLLYVDARMALETAQVWAVTKELAGSYAAALAAQDDSLIPDMPCTSKATFHGGALAASCAAHILKRFITGQTLDLVYSFSLNDWAAIRI